MHFKELDSGASCTSIHITHEFLATCGRLVYMCMHMYRQKSPQENPMCVDDRQQVVRCLYAITRSYAALPLPRFRPTALLVFSVRLRCLPVFHPPRSAGSSVQPIVPRKVRAVRQVDADAPHVVRRVRGAGPSWWIFLRQ